MKGSPSRPTTSKTTIGNRVRVKGTATEKSIRQLFCQAAIKSPEVNSCRSRPLACRGGGSVHCGSLHGHGVARGPATKPWSRTITAIVKAAAMSTSMAGGNPETPPCS